LETSSFLDGTHVKLERRHQACITAISICACVR